MYRFEKLRVYNSTLQLIQEVYKIVKTLPKEEAFALSDQLRRSAISIALNIAEGTDSGSDKSFINFLRIALRSLYETIAGLKLANMLYKVEMQNCTLKCDKVGKELNV